MPREVQNWVESRKSGEEKAVGPPWLYTCTGGSSPSGADTPGWVGG